MWAQLLDAAQTAFVKRHQKVEVEGELVKLLRSKFNVLT
jgi:hypothetical protein